MQRQLILVIVIALLTMSAAAQAPDLPVMLPEVINVYPHDDGAFTQGLLWDNGFFYESTGLRGQSTLRRVEIETGRPLETVSLEDHLFAEGLERVGDRLIQLTWQAGLAFVYDFDTLEHLDTISYQGEGWGLCYDGPLPVHERRQFLPQHSRSRELPADFPRRGYPTTGRSCQRSFSTNWNASRIIFTPTPGIPITSSALTNSPATLSRSLMPHRC